MELGKAEHMQRCGTIFQIGRPIDVLRFGSHRVISGICHNIVAPFVVVINGVAWVVTVA